MIQIKSMKDPFKGDLASPAVDALVRADAMGLLPSDDPIESLDVPTFMKVIGYIHRAGIATNIQLDLGKDLKTSGPALKQALSSLITALEGSPAPGFEWKSLVKLLGPELLSRLVGVSASSIHRYKESKRTTPGDVAERLHFLSLIVGDLAGAYNEFGIRQWFERKRAQLEGKTPADCLKAGWKPDQSGPQRVRNLARALVASPAT